MKLSHLTVVTFLLSISAFQLGCNNAEKKIPVSKITTEDTIYLEAGKKLAAETQATLAKNLTNAISTGGTEYAVTFCNTQAVTLTDSMSHVLNARIKRVSDKPRNPANLANEVQAEYIAASIHKLQKGERPEPTIKESNGKIVALYPIITNSMCLQCHGTKDTEINAETLNKINTLYPLDKATGYGINQVRGLWVVELIKK